ncbi:hypothetical protein SARC_04359 [Sphaeroforma arctica JP610]|uniref:Uncharacterized protein n=1 Tax=Sphaeroforma arctica JP610 TaxID=667725 RepID=A0A0L0G554_9EUKA|nr:hypothetical protein SARC_04359 [Sphaeroforma arctica JP610]KNC83393.1 hypothetical protein SARC_04359 [Sphaeroforma arctica JP610]|eukprot:XP_014157295.1 hypothetical protein SARC_04359 [Sphaeroforma arctica JP610]
MPSIRQSRRQQQLAPETRERQGLEPRRTKRQESKQGEPQYASISPRTSGISRTQTDELQSNKEILRQEFLTHQRQTSVPLTPPHEGQANEVTQARRQETRQAVDRETKCPLKCPKQRRRQS